VVKYSDEALNLQRMACKSPHGDSSVLQQKEMD
jgi:hypothetical protein